MHPQIEPNHKILLHQTLSIEESVEIDHRVPDVILVVWISGLRLGVFLLCDCKIKSKRMNAVR